MKPSTPLKMMNGVPIIFEDKFVLVVNKPAGIPSQSDQDGTQGVIEKIRKSLPQAALVHRLDRPVGGLLVVARNSKSAAKLSAALREDQFGKDYLAVLWGKPEKASGTLEDFLLRDGHSNTSSVVACLSEAGNTNSTGGTHAHDIMSAQTTTSAAKKSVLHYETLATLTLPAEAVYGSKWCVESPFASLFGDSPAPTDVPNSVEKLSETGCDCGSQVSADTQADGAPILTLVRIQLETGRHHQIRVQMAHMGCPVLGDRKYGADHLGKLEPKYRPDMPALFSYRLTFKHPESGEQHIYEILPENSYPFDLFPLNDLLEKMND